MRSSRRRAISGESVSRSSAPTSSGSARRRRTRFAVAGTGGPPTSGRRAVRRNPSPLPEIANVARPRPASRRSSPPPRSGRPRTVGGFPARTGREVDPAGRDGAGSSRNPPRPWRATLPHPLSATGSRGRVDAPRPRAPVPPPWRSAPAPKPPVGRPELPDRGGLPDRVPFTGASDRKGRVRGDPVGRLPDEGREPSPRPKLSVERSRATSRLPATRRGDCDPGRSRFIPSARGGRALPENPWLSARGSPHLDPARLAPPTGRLGRPVRSVRPPAGGRGAPLRGGRVPPRGVGRPPKPPPNPEPDGRGARLALLGSPPGRGGRAGVARRSPVLLRLPAALSPPLWAAPPRRLPSSSPLPRAGRRAGRRVPPPSPEVRSVSDGF